jgi:hypothetical protein
VGEARSVEAEVRHSVVEEHSWVAAEAVHLVGVEER